MKYNRFGRGCSGIEVKGAWVYKNNVYNRLHVRTTTTTMNQASRIRRR
jgi:hypothetical protein